MNLSETLPLHAKYRGSKEALLDAGTQERVTYAELEARVGVAAKRLSDAGAAGSIVGLAMRDTIDHVVALFACARTEAIIQPLDCRWSSGEIESALAAFGAEFVVLDEGTAYDGGVPRLSLFGDDDESGTLPLHDEEGDPPLILSLSSGTTGFPKGPLLRTSQFLSRFRVYWAELGLNGESRFLSCTPLYYGGARGFVLGVLYSGGTVVLLRNPFTPAEFLACANQFRADSVFLVPTMLRRFLGDPNFCDSPPALATVISSGAALHADERARLVALLGEGFMQYYASTEGGGISLLKGSTGPEKNASVGIPVLGVDVECVDETGRPVPVGEIGRIRYRGPSVADSYYSHENDPNVFRDGWFYPGDLGSFDDEGFLYIRGRSKDVIIRGGVNIYPADIEAVVSRHPAVQECAAVGWPSREFNEEVAVFVVANDPSIREELLATCRESLARYKWPRDIFIVDDFPRNSLGKVRKDVLAAGLRSI